MRDACRRAAASRPRITRSVVVLPAPSGPIRPNISPRCTSKLTPVDAPTELAVAAGQALDLDHARRRVIVRSLAAPPAGARSSRASAGMPGLKRPSRVVEADLDLVDELHALVAGLDVLRA